LQYAPVETITVQPGDSLWKIAEDHNVSGVSTTDIVHYVQKINHISSDSLVSGQLLKIPVA
ncbi:MAG: LysM peptidoglycan-binding domain-containing protein, partial [Lancefieldella rimae]